MRPKSSHFKMMVLIILPIFLTAERCADETEENQYYKSEGLDEYRYDEVPANKESAIEAWEQFLKSSQDLIADTRTNLESFRFEMEDRDSSEKLEMMRQFENAQKALARLERKRTQRNDAFSVELEHFDPESIKRNTDFSNQFNTDLNRINAALRRATETQ